LTKERITLGKKGEDLAVSHLKKQGIKVILRNYRQKSGEIDIIARDGDFLVFVEVKTRRSLAFGSPFEAVTHKKQAQITRVAMEYISRNNISLQACRFDVVSIVMSQARTVQIEHQKNAFDAVMF